MSRKPPARSAGSQKMCSGQENRGTAIALFKWATRARDRYDQETFKGQQAERR